MIAVVKGSVASVTEITVEKVVEIRSLKSGSALVAEIEAGTAGETRFPRSGAL